MDGFDSKQFYGHSISLDDPKLRTTAKNYEFKYNSSEYLERLINNVKMDHEQKKPCCMHNRKCLYPIKVRSTSLQRKGKITNVETEIGHATSRTTVIKVMNDDEIEAMLTEALVSKANSISAKDKLFASQTSLNGLMVSRRPSFTHKLERRDTSFQTELIPEPVPQWVDIKPIAKGNMDIVYLNNNNEIDEDKVDVDEQEEDDLVLRKIDINIQLDDETPPLSPMSIGVESRLNDSEREEMERQAEDTERDLNVATSENGSELVDSSDDQDDDDDEIEMTQDEVSSLDSPEFTGQPIIHIQHNPRQEDMQTIPIIDSPHVSTPRSQVSRGSPKKKFSGKEKPVIMPMDRRVKKQIEALKHEKIRIFSKMTTIQEKIIEILDKIKLSLLELSLPDGQAERKLRERNAFEFSVRFSRNFIFPLGRMIDDLRASPKADYCSAVTNEPCMKVCGIYGLLCQALQCYHRQLRHFFTDSIPKKFDIILGMIADTTNMCLEKKIFDRRDTLVQSLLLRCSIFMDFIMKLAEQKRALDDEISIRSGRKDLLKSSKTSSKWDLTMNLNNLNMYEPKLIPKKTKKKSYRRQQPPLSTIVAPTACVVASTPPTTTVTSARTQGRPKPSENTSDAIKEISAAVETTRDPVDTQVQQINNCDSLQLLNSVIEDCHDPDLTKTVIETLQAITKDEVQHLLSPILSNLNSILRNPNKPQSVESVLSVLNAHLLAKSKQQKINAAAAESNTQKGNTHQKEITRRSLKASKEERRKGKETRTKTTKSVHNIKQDSTERTEKLNTHMSGANSMHNIKTPTSAKAAPSGVVAKVGVVAANRSTSSMKTTNKMSGATTLMKHKTRSSEAFLTAASTIASRKPIPPAALPAVVSRVQFDEEILPPIQPAPLPPPEASSSLPSHHMTSQHLKNTTTTCDVSAPEYRPIGDGEYRMEYSRDSDNRQIVTLTEEVGKGQKDDQKNQIVEQAPRRTISETPWLSQMEQLNYCSNAAYTFVKYYDADEANNGQQDVEQNEIPDEECFTDSCTRLTPNRQSQNLSFKSLNSNSPSPKMSSQKQQQPLELQQQQQSQGTEQPQAENKEEEDENKYDRDVKALLEERSNFIECCKEDPLYTNPQFSQPWKVLSKISHNLAQEIAENFENDLSFGEESYVRDFINMEMQT